MPKKLKPDELRKRRVRVAMGTEKSRYATKPVLPERHLFVTEGTKTEPLYLQSMIERIAEKVGEGVKQQLVVHGGGDNTLSLLQRATDIMDSAGTSSDKSKDFQHVWVIYDRDSFPGDDFDNTASRCDALTKKFQRKGQNRTFHAIWSNECFEVWLLFHFMLLSSGVPRSQYADMLSKQLGTPYDKASPPNFDKLDWRKAVKNARKQMSNFPADAPPSKRNPCTNFYYLVESFAAYI